jgi:hypothetical protein
MSTDDLSMLTYTSLAVHIKVRAMRCNTVQAIVQYHHATYFSDKSICFNKMLCIAESLTLNAIRAEDAVILQAAKIGAALQKTVVTTATHMVTAIFTRRR